MVVSQTCSTVLVWTVRPGQVDEGQMVLFELEGVSA
jgi:hypothetical protein